jgi:hypothetical protein
VFACLRPTFLAIALLGLAAPACAAEKETRHFTVAVDDKPAGSCRMTIQKREDGSVAVSAEADINVRLLVLKYKYTFRGSEVWKDGRLQSFESNTNDNGKKFSVAATAGRDGTSVRSGGREVLVRGDVWLTTYWHLPPKNARGQTLALVDADTGKLLNAQLEHVGDEQIPVAGNVVKATRYRVSGAVKANLWFDKTDRLVRQHLIVDGHTTLLELTRLQRD